MIARQFFLNKFKKYCFKLNFKKFKKFKKSKKCFNKLLKFALPAQFSIILPTLNYFLHFCLRFGSGSETPHFVLTFFRRHWLTERHILVLAFLHHWFICHILFEIFLIIDWFHWHIPSEWFFLYLTGRRMLTWNGPGSCRDFLTPFVAAKNRSDRI